MAKKFLQVRVEESDKEEACAILEELGTNMSAVVNMLVKQIILTRGIPFRVEMQQNNEEDSQRIDLDTKSR